MRDFKTPTRGASQQSNIYNYPFLKTVQLRNELQTTSYKGSFEVVLNWIDLPEYFSTQNYAVEKLRSIIFRCDGEIFATHVKPLLFSKL